MAPGTLLRAAAILCTVAVVCRCQTSPRRRRLPTVSPAADPTQLALAEEDLSGSTFGRRLTARPRRPGAVLSLQPGPTPPPLERTPGTTPPRRRGSQFAPQPRKPDWTPIWPGDRVTSSLASGGGATGATESLATVATASDAPAAAAGEGSTAGGGSQTGAEPGRVDRAPVTEYYFSSTVVPSAGAAPSTFPPVRLPTATFIPAATPTRRVPASASSRRPVLLNSRPPVAAGVPGRRRSVTRLADRLSALVTSRLAQTRIISPTRPAAADAPTSRVPPGPQSGPPREAIETVAAPDGSSFGLEPSTRPPLTTAADLVTLPPTSAPARPAGEPITVTPDAVDPTPASAPCVVTPQGPGGYCRDGDLLTVLTRDPQGAWQEFRVVRLPSATVAALDGEAVEAEASAVTEDPIGVTEASVLETAGQSTPSVGGQTVTSSPEISDTTEATTASTPGDSDVTSTTSLPSDAVTISPLPEPEVVPLEADVSGAQATTPASAETPPESQPTLLPNRRRTRPTLTWPTSLRPEVNSTAPGSDAAESSTPTAEAADVQEAVDEAKAAEKDAVEAVLSSDVALSGDPSGELASSTEAGDVPSSTEEGTEPPSAVPDPQPPTVSEGKQDEEEGAIEITTQATPVPDEEVSKTVEAQVITSTVAPSEENKDIVPAEESELAQDREGVAKSTTFGSTPTPDYTTAPSTAYPTGTTSPPATEAAATEAPTSEAPVTSVSAPPVVTTTEATHEEEGPTAATLPSGGAGSTPRGTWSTPDRGHGGAKVTFPAPFTAPPSQGFNKTRTTSQPPDSGHTTATHHTTDDYGFTTDHYDYTYDYTTGSGFTTTGTSGFTTAATGYPPESTTNYGTEHTDYTTETTGFSTDSAPTTESTTTDSDGSTTGTRPSTFLTPPVIQSTHHPDTTDPDFTSTLGPTTSRKPGITHSTVVPPVEVYVQFLLDTSWETFCGMRHKFLQTVVDLLNKEDRSNLTADNAILFNIPMCGGSAVRARRASAILVFLYIVDDAGKYERALTERVQPLWEAAGVGAAQPLEGLVREVHTVRPTHPQLVADMEGEDSAGVIVAVAVSCVAVASLVLLAVLLAIVRHRRRAAQAAQRCNPVSLEDYGVESVFSSLRRKNKLRRSVRSYLNHAFDDHDAPSNSVNFAGLANLSGDLGALKEEFDSIPTGVMPTLEDLPPGSEDKNRYANVLPVPETRVVLDQKTAAPNSDYINANYVRGAKEEPQFYVATQGPLESTVNDFWRMIWETQSKVILCLTDIVERGVRRCAEYLPPSEALDRHRLYGDFQVTLMAKVKKDKYVVSTVQLKNMDSNLYREVTHLWYSGWPERGVPSDLDSLVQYTLEARKAMKANIGPTVVHCSPGTGRTGVMLAVDMCVRQFEASRSADIMRTVFRIRQDRAGAVQTREQYALIYKVLNQYAASVTSGNLPPLE